LLFQGYVKKPAAVFAYSYPLRCDEAARLPECLIFQLSERFSQSGSSYVLVKGGQIASFL
jgi:hypothetical protein